MSMRKIYSYIYIYILRIYILSFEVIFFISFYFSETLTIRQKKIYTTKCIYMQMEHNGNNSNRIFIYFPLFFFVFVVATLPVSPFSNTLL